MSQTVKIKWNRSHEPMGGQYGFVKGANKNRRTLMFKVTSNTREYILHTMSNGKLVPTAKFKSLKELRKTCDNSVKAYFV